MQKNKINKAAAMLEEAEDELVEALKDVDGSFDYAMNAQESSWRNSTISISTTSSKGRKQ